MLHNIIDTHLHMDDPYFMPDIENWCKKLEDGGIYALITSGSEMPSSKRSVELAERFDFMYASVGIYPNEYNNVPEGYLDVLREYASYEKVVAIGEIGLDYGFDPKCDREAQKKIFEQQLILAKELNLPVVLHDRDADEDMLPFIEKYRPQGVVHRIFSQPKYCRRFMELGICMGIGPQITYDNAGRLWEIVKEMPLELLTLETDAPFIPNARFAGQKADSLMIGEVAEKIAEVRGGITAQEVIDIATENSKRVFGIK